MSNVGEGFSMQLGDLTRWLMGEKEEFRYVNCYETTQQQDTLMIGRILRGLSFFYGIGGHEKAGGS